MDIPLHIRVCRALAACFLASCGLLVGTVAPGPAASADRSGEEVQPGVGRLDREAARLDRLAAAYAAYYGRGPDVVARLLRIGLAPDDVSVVLWVARQSVADPHAVASTRLKAKMSWVEVMRAYGVASRALRTRLDGPRPAHGPYARAYRVLGGQLRGRLTDAEVRDLVQLRLLSEHYRISPSRVIARRGAGASATGLVLEAQAAAERRRPPRTGGPS